LKSEKKRRIK